MDIRLTTYLILLQLMWAIWADNIDKKLRDGPLISFGESIEIQFGGYNFTSINTIQEDLLRSGGFIIADNGAVVEVSPDLNNVTIIAGNPHESSMRNGAGLSAYFSQIADIFQHNNGEVILLADTNNHCIRMFNRTTSQVSTFAGQCSIGGIFSNTNASTAYLTNPHKILYIENENALYYLLANSLVKHDLDTDLITQEYDYLPYTYSAVLDSTNRYIYISHTDGVGVSRFDRTTNSRTVVTGFFHENAAESGTVDGNFTNARFETLTGISWLIQDQVLLVGERNAGLRVVNLVDEIVTTICTDQSLFLCDEIFSPYVVTTINNSIYTATSEYVGGGDSISWLVKLSYSQPTCDPVLSCEQDIPIDLTNEVYTHLESVGCSCRVENSTVLPGNSTCVRAAYENGTVYGTWERKSPVCEERKVIKLSNNHVDSSANSADNKDRSDNKGVVNNTAHQTTMSVFLITLCLLTRYRAL